MPQRQVRPHPCAPQPFPTCAYARLTLVWTATIAVEHPSVEELAAAKKKLESCEAQLASMAEELEAEQGRSRRLESELEEKGAELQQASRACGLMAF